MKYHVQFSKSAVKALKKLDKYTSALILAWVEKNLENCSDPRAHGKGLTSNHSGEWRYRTGDYRLIADIQDDKILILIINIGHRREIYM